MSKISRSYAAPNVSRDWASSRETHMAVAVAIHAISDKSRSAQAIWEAPTPAEWDHITMAVQEYVEAGDFQPEPDGRYSWGMETIKLNGDGE